MTGSLGEEDRHGWTFEGSAGDEVIITLDGLGGLDPVVQLLGPGGSVLAENDDFDGTDSRVEATLTTSGTHTIIARGYSGGAGDYRLGLFVAGQEPTDTTAAPGGGTIGYGETVTGSLAEERPDEWRFSAAAGDVITAVLEGPDIDSVISLLDPDGEVLVYEDNYGQGGDEVIANLALPASGTYTIVVSEWSGEAGNYELELTLVSGGGETTTTTEGSTTTLTVPEELGTGDVQITLLWSSAADLDLLVLDPEDNLIYHGEREAPNGGVLDADANRLCDEVDPSPVENVFWPTGEAPRGTYLVLVDSWSSCGASEPTDFQLVITLDGAEVDRISSSITADDPDFEHEFTY